MEKLLDFLQIAGKLKDTYRFSEVPEMKGIESSADHSWRLSLMTMLLADELKLDIDVERALKIAIVHDLAEALTGDIDIRLIHEKKVSKEDKFQKELDALKTMCTKLSSEQADSIMELWHECHEAKTREAKFVKVLDKIEGLTYIAECGVFDEADLIGTYGNEAAQDFPEVIPFFRQLKKRLKKLCLEKGFEWKAEYDI